MADKKHLIYKEDLLDLFTVQAPSMSYNKMFMVVANAPTVDAVEVVHGRWEDRWGGKYANPHYECSVCKKSAPYKCDRDVLDTGLWLQDLTDYCPNCGADMRGDGDG